MDHNGQSTLVTLGTFAVAQGAGLVFGAKGQGPAFNDETTQKVFPWILLFYACLSLYTLWGIVKVLRAVDSVESEDGQTFRQYNNPTITFGRWLLPAAASLSLFVGILGAAGALPGQTIKRKVFSGEVTVRVGKLEPNFAGPTSLDTTSYLLDVGQMNRWMDWALDSFEPLQGSGERLSTLLWIEQAIPFDDDYQSFTVTLTPPSSVVLGDKVAFLVSEQAPGRFRPVYRQLPFERNADETASNRLTIENPRKNERLFLLAKASMVDGSPAGSHKSEEFTITLERQQ